MPVFSEAIKSLSNADKQSKFLAKCQANGQVLVNTIWGGCWLYGAMQPFGAHYSQQCKMAHIHLHTYLHINTETT